MRSLYPFLNRLFNFSLSGTSAVHAQGFKHKSSLISSQSIIFPADAGIRNVPTQFGARGDGITDDTAAIQSAFQATQGRSEILYFPAGIYLVSKPVWFRGFMFVLGESLDRTVIKLKDDAPGYQYPNNPNWLMGTTQPASPDGRSGDNRRSAITL